MYIKKVLLTLALLFVSSCAKTPVVDVNDDIVGSGTSGVVSQVKKSSKDKGFAEVTNEIKKEVKRVSPISEEEVEELEGESALNTTLHFSYDSDIIEEQGRENLNKIYSLLTSKKKVSIIVEGYCDERGTKAYNLALGARRAQAVKNYLTEKGISKKRITTVSYGEERPIAIGATRDAYAKNRRVQFKVK